MSFEEVEDQPEQQEPKSRSRNPDGRPTILQPTEDTFKQINGLARIQCTQREAAAVLGVHRETFAKFLDTHEKAREAWEDGGETGKASLRRHQFKSAESGNATMQIWLGKQWLDQKDKSENTMQGPNGGPIEFVGLLGRLTTGVCPKDDAGDGQ
jgi:hypothetical protein